MGGFISAPAGARGFRLLWIARATSQFGDEISLLALPWLIAEETGSPLVVALLEVMAFTPVLVLALPLGALADRRSRRRSMIQADLGRLVLLMSIPVIAIAGFGVSVVHVLLVSAVAGCLQVLFDASSQAALPDLLGDADIVTANARLGMTEGVAAVCGPALAGVLIAVISARGAITVDALTFLASAILIWAIAMPHERVQAMREPLSASIRVGMQSVRDTAHLRDLAIVLGIANLAAGIAISMNVIFFQRTLALAGWQAGAIYATNGIGGIVGSTLSTRLVARTSMGRAVLVGVAAVAVGVVLTGLTTSATWWVLATGGSAAVGFGIGVAAVASVSLRQRVVPGPLLGRVSAIFRIVVDGPVALGALAGGLVGEFVGIRVAIFAAGAILVLTFAGGLATRLRGDDPPALLRAGDMHPDAD